MLARHSSKSTDIVTTLPASRAASQLFRSQQEALAFSTFELSSTRQLAAALHDESWIQPALQLAEANPALRLALMAVGTMTKRYEQNRLSVPRSRGDVELVQLAQMQHRLAASQLQVATSVVPESNQLCHSFLAVGQFLMGNPTKMLLHLSHAIASVAQLDNSNSRSYDFGLRQQLRSLVALSDMAATVWLNGARAVSDAPLDFQLLFTANPRPLLPPPTGDDGLEALGLGLVEMANEIGTFRHAVASAHPEPSLSMMRSAAEVKTIFQYRLRLWYDSFARAAALHHRHQSRRRLLLHANYLMSCHMVDCTNTLPAAFRSGNEHADAATDAAEDCCTFTKVLDLADEAFNHEVRSGSNRGSKQDAAVATGFLPLFSFDLALIPPLFYVAQRAPSFALRQKAIYMLRERPWREGAWDSATMASIAQTELSAVGGLEDRAGVASVQLYGPCMGPVLVQYRSPVG